VIDNAASIDTEQVFKNNLLVIFIQYLNIMAASWLELQAMANLAEPSPRLRKIFICDGLTSHTLISAAAGLEARAAATLAPTHCRRKAM
jgi:hypothetical protein